MSYLADVFTTNQLHDPAEEGLKRFVRAAGVVLKIQYLSTTAWLPSAPSDLGQYLEYSLLQIERTYTLEI